MLWQNYPLHRRILADSPYWQGPLLDMQNLWPQIRRIYQEPERLNRLHYSKALSFIHQIFEVGDHDTLSKLFDINRQDFDEHEQALIKDGEFREAIEARFGEVRGQTLRLFGENSSSDYNAASRLLYHCTRIHKPTIIVETGVLDGFSSAFWLKGLHDNGFGHLYSIDLPARLKTHASSEHMAFNALPAGLDPGWIVPDYLRDRFSLRLGSSRDLLQPLLQELGQIDLFFHDSLHTNDYMLWEYETVQPYLKPNGLLVSDDVFWNAAFLSFTRRENMRKVIARGIGIAQR
jgi:predicted O-methyltransferase YrrM